MLKRAQRHPSVSKVRKASLHANCLQWVRSWSKFTGSFKLSWLSQQLLSRFQILGRLKLQKFLAVRSAGGYLRPSNCSPQSPQRRIFHHLWLCVKLTFPSLLFRPFERSPRTDAVNSGPASIAPAETPSRGPPQAALPQSVTSARPPRWGRRCGEEASPRSSSTASTAAG